MNLDTSLNADSILQSINSKLPTFITSNYKYIALTFIFLLVTNYLASRHSDNIKSTTNQSYTKPDEYVQQIHITNLAFTPKQFIFWNGNFQSTYQLIVLLKNDFIVQPIYIEEYTIAKHLDIPKFNKILTDFKNVPRLTQKDILHRVATSSIAKKDLKKIFMLLKNTSFIKI
jgi:hypothetical protein